MASRPVRSDGHLAFFRIASIRQPGWRCPCSSDPEAASGPIGQWSAVALLGEAPLVQAVCEQRGRLVKRMGRFLIDVNRLTSLGEEPAAGVGDGHRYVVVAEVDCPDQRVRGGWEEQRGGAPDAGCRIASPLGDQALRE